MTEDGGKEPRRSGRLSARLFGETVEAGPPRPERARPPVPRSLRLAALLVGVEAAGVAVGAGLWLWLTLTSTPDSMARALAEVVIIALVAAGLAVAARGLARAAGWARGPVIAAQVFFGLSGFVAAFEAERPEIGVPLLVLVAAELYLLATPESRLAYLERGVTRGR